SQSLELLHFELDRTALVFADYGAAGNFLHHAIEVEAARFLSRGKFAEALQPLGDIETGGRQQEDVIYEPVVVIHALILSAFKRIGAQIFDQGGAQLREGLHPDLQAMGILDEESDFPIVVTQSGDVAI